MALLAVDQTASAWTGMSPYENGNGEGGCCFIQTGVERTFTDGVDCSVTQCPYQLWWQIPGQANLAGQQDYTSSECGNSSPTVSPKDDVYEAVGAYETSASFEIYDYTTHFECTTNYNYLSSYAQDYYSQGILEAITESCQTIHGANGIIVSQIAALDGLTDYHVRFANGTILLAAGGDTTWQTLHNSGSYVFNYMNQTTSDNTNLLPSFVNNQGAIATYENSNWNQVCFS